MKKTERSKPSAGRTSRASYRRHPMSLVQRIAVTASAVITFAILAALLAYILIMGVPNLKPGLFAWHYTSDNCSMTPAIINTLLMVVLSLLLSVPFGIGAAIYLVEYAKRGNKLVKVVRLTAETLSTEEALKAVPDSFREGSFGLGAGKLRTVFRIVLPSAVPGIFSGIILAIGRIVGETAALIFTAGTFSGVAGGVMESGRTLAVHMYCLLNEGLHRSEAYATAVVLLVMVIGINALSGAAAKRIARRTQ